MKTFEEARDIAQQWENEQVSSYPAQVGRALLKHIQTSPQVTDELRTFLESVADFMDRNVNMQGGGPEDPPDYASSFDYELAQCAAELRMRLSAQPAAETPVVNKVFTLQTLCSYLPEEVMWGDALNPAMLESILRRAILAEPLSTETNATTKEEVRKACFRLAASPEAKPAVYAMRVHAWGGSTEYHDYEMSDGSIQTFKSSEAPWSQKIVSVASQVEAKPVAVDLPEPDVSYGPNAYFRAYTPKKVREILKSVAPQEQAPADKDAKLIGDIGIAAIGMDFATSYNTNHPGEWHFTNSGLKSVSNSLIDAVSAVALEALETSEPMIKTLESLQRHADAIRALKAEVSNG